MKANGNVRIEMTVKGNTGYANRSTMKLSFPKLGQLLLSDDEWNLSPVLHILHTITYVELSIPSGTLETSGAITVSIEENNYGQEVIIFESHFTWYGKQAGLLGGMSGYTSFTVCDVYVFSGVYFHNSVRHVWHHNCPLDQYNNILMRSRDLFDEHFSSIVNTELSEDNTIYGWEKEVATSDNPEIKEAWDIWLKWLLWEETIQVWNEFKVNRKKQWEENQLARKSKVSRKELDEDYDDTDYSKYIWNEDDEK